MFHAYTHLHPVGLIIALTLSSVCLTFFTLWYRRRQRIAGTYPPAPRKPDALWYVNTYFLAFYCLNAVYLVCIMFGKM